MDVQATVKWSKKSPHEWQFQTEAVFAQIDKITGWIAPYEWRVYPLPRPHKQRWIAIARGSARTLAEAKAKAEAHITPPPGA